GPRTKEGVIMPRGRGAGLLALVGMTALAWALPTAARAQGCPSCATPYSGGVCQTHDCPPAFHHCMERPPCIRIHCGCPPPVCNPWALPNCGCSQPCGPPWPLPPAGSHCPGPVPAAFVHLGPPVGLPGLATGFPGTWKSATDLPGGGAVP